ncbi:electron transfer flavoprotein subunit alpha/FixB family protein [Tessaracoccus sp. Z1128]
MSRTSYVIVAPNSGVDKLVTAAAGLGGRLVALVVGRQQLAAAVAASGVDEVKWFDCPDNGAAEAFAPAVASAVTYAPGVLLAGRDPASRVLLGAAAAAVLAPVATGVTELSAEGDLTLVTAGVYGGIASRTMAYPGPVALLMDDGGITGTGGPAAPILSQAGQKLAIEVTSRQPSREAAVDLGTAQRVVGVGRGLKAREDLSFVGALAGALGAELGCTRPLAEGLEWLPKDRYIGISGQHISPQLYFAIGISGQLQHMAGARSAHTIVAINSDPAAPIIKDADYMVVGDLYELVPAITAELG